jgi:hypothetical protein
VDAVSDESSAMPRPSRSEVTAGRNLLLGLLALQNNFISREALLSAFKSRGVGG